MQRFEKPLQNTDIHFRALTFVVFGYVYKHYIGAVTSLNLLRVYFLQIKEERSLKVLTVKT